MQRLANWINGMRIGQVRGLFFGVAAFSYGMAWFFWSRDPLLAYVFFGDGVIWSFLLCLSF